MSSRGPSVIGFIFLLALLAAPSSAMAQEAGAGAPSRRPSRGLFGAADAASPKRSSMTLLLSTFGAHDDEFEATDLQGLGTDDQCAADPGTQAALTYRRPGQRLQLTWTADATARGYAAADAPISVLGETAMMLTGRITRRTSIRLAQQAGYVPQSVFVGVPRLDEMAGSSEAIAAVPGNRLITEPILNADSMAGLAYTFGGGASFTLDYGHHRATSLDARALDVMGNRVAARFTLPIARSIAARVGYGLHAAGHRIEGTRRQMRTHDLDVGIDYRRSVSLTRRTRFSMSTGTTLMGADERAVADGTGQGLKVMATGSAQLVREIGRSWGARIGYDRAVQFSDRIAAPALTDTVSAQASGFMGRRLGIAMSAAYTIGRVGVGARADDYKSLTGSAQLTYALTRRLAVFADYSLYSYSFATTTQLPSWLPGTRHRASGRAGLTWRVPVLR